MQVKELFTPLHERKSSKKGKKKIKDDKGGLGTAPVTGAPQGVDARGYGSVDVMPYQEEDRIP